MKLEAAGRQARAEVQGPQTQLYRGAHRASEAAHQEKNRTTRFHSPSKGKTQVCELLWSHKRSAPSPTETTFNIAAKT